MRWFDSLRRRGDIARVRRRGRTAGFTTLSGYALAAASAARPLVGITVSKSVGGAVERNRVRRRIRAALEGCAIPTGSPALLLVARPAARAASYQLLAADVAAALDRLGPAQA